MPNYGGLSIRVTADTRPMERSIASAATSMGQRMARSMAESVTSGAVKAAQGAVGTMAKGLEATGRAMGAVTKTMATALGTATIAATGFGVASFKTAARVGEMDATLRALAKANDLSYPEMQKVVAAVRHTGIEAGVAQGLVAQFSRNNLDLAKSTKLARVAQDAAVISGQNSTETLDQLVHGIITQNSMVLRNAGLNVQAGAAMDKYAKSLGKSRKDLTDAERSQAVLNAVLAAGSTIAGAYTAAMEEPGKVLRSFPRVIDDIRVSVGEGLVQAFGPLIIKVYELGKGLSKALAPGGGLSPVLKAIGGALTEMVKPLTGVIERWTKWLEELKPGQVKGIAAAVKSFAPQIVALATALATFAGGQWASRLPVLGKLLGNLGGPVGAVVAGLGALAFASPQARAALGDLTKQLSSALLPAMRPLQATVGRLAQAIGPILGQALRAAGPLLGTFGTLLVQAADVFIQLLRAAEPLIPMILKLAQAFLQGLSQALRQVGPMLVSLMGQLVQGLAPAMVQLVPLALELGKVIGPLLGAAIRIITPLIPLATRLLTFLAQTMRGILPVLTWLANAIAYVVRWLLGGSPGLIPAFQAAQRVIGSVANFLKSVVVGAFRLMQSAIMAAWNAIGRAASLVWNGIRNVIRSATNSIKAVVTAGWNATKGIVVAVLRIIRSAVQFYFNAYKAIITTAIRLVRVVITTGWNVIRSVTTTVLNVIRNVITRAFNFYRSIISAAVHAIQVVITNGWNAVRTIVVTAVNAIRAVVRTLASIFTNAARDAVNALKNAFRTALAAIAGFVTRVIVNPIRNAVRGVIALFRNAGRDALQGLKDGIVAAMRSIGGWVKSRIVDPVVNAVKRFFGIKSPSTVMAGIGQNLTGGLIKGMVSKGPLAIARTVFGGLPGALAAMVKRGIVAVGSLPGKALNALRGAGGLAKRLLGGLWHSIFGGEGAGAVAGGVAGLAAQIIKQFPGLMITSALRRGDTKSYHGRGLARDLAPPGGMTPGNVALMTRAAEWIGGNLSGQLLEGIYNPNLSIKNGRRVPPSFWGAATWAEHRNHIHIAAEMVTAAAKAVGGNLGGWISQAMGITGVGQNWAAPLRWRAMFESGGNPAITQQIWDINAAQGNRARGLMQTTPTTFAAFALGNMRNIFNPVHNLVAAIRYIMSKGGLSYLLYRNAIRKGYARGGVISEPVAGFGLSGRAYLLGERGPELVSPLRGPAPNLAGSQAEIVALLRRIATAAEQGTSVVIDGREVARVVDREMPWVA